MISGSVPEELRSSLLLVLQAHLWTLSVGHAMTSAALFGGIWRIYSQKVNEDQVLRVPQSRCFRDLLFLQKEPDRIHIWVFLPDVLVLTSWQILDPPRRVEPQHHLEVSREKAVVSGQPPLPFEPRRTPFLGVSGPACRSGPPHSAVLQTLRQQQHRAVARRRLRVQGPSAGERLKMAGTAFRPGGGPSGSERQTLNQPRRVT